jgi:hypothetical protein
MTPIEAEKITHAFHGSIKDLRPDAIVRSSRELPYTSARIKYAHFVYGEHLVKTATITEEKYQEIMESYGLVDSLFREDPAPINDGYRAYLDGLKDGRISDFRMPNPFGEIGPVNDFHNFLGECWFLEYKTHLFSDNPLGAFIYDGIRNKATMEQDIQTLIKLVNTGLTRAVDYPEKTNSTELMIL